MTICRTKCISSWEILLPSFPRKTFSKKCPNNQRCNSWSQRWYQQLKTGLGMCICSQQKPYSPCVEICFFSLATLRYIFFPCIGFVLFFHFLYRSQGFPHAYLCWLYSTNHLQPIKGFCFLGTSHTRNKICVCPFLHCSPTLWDVTQHTTPA